MSKAFIGGKEYFPGIGKIPFEGPKSDNPLSFKFYDEAKTVAGRSMKEHLRFAVAYWHTMTATGADPFGAGTIHREWNRNPDPLAAAEEKADAAFEFTTKLGAPYYCFHDVDAAPTPIRYRTMRPTYRKSGTCSSSGRRPAAFGCCGTPPTCSPIPGI
jgi:xylose isomerase